MLISLCLVICNDSQWLASKRGAACDDAFPVFPRIVSSVHLQSFCLLVCSQECSESFMNHFCSSESIQDHKLQHYKLMQSADEMPDLLQSLFTSGSNNLVSWKVWELNSFWTGSELTTSYERPCRRMNFKIWRGMLRKFYLLKFRVATS